LMAAPVIVQYQGTTGSWVFALVLTAIFIWAVSQSKKQSPSLT